MRQTHLGCSAAVVGVGSGFRVLARAAAPLGPIPQSDRLSCFRGVHLGWMEEADIG